MPKLYRVGKYIIFFLSNENNEPIHVHVGIVNPAPDTTKIWITQSGGCIVADNQSRISKNDLNEIIETIQNNYFYICSKWKEHFKVDKIKFYC